MVDKLLKSPTGIPNGVLQRFLDPLGEKNCNHCFTSVSITAKWSPAGCSLAKSESINRLDNLKYDIYHRAPTIDGSDMNTMTKGIRGSCLSLEIDKICINMAKHIQKISDEKIVVERLTTHFKVNTTGKVYFLFCSFLQYTDTTQSRPILVRSSEDEPRLLMLPEAFDHRMMVVNKPRSLEKSSMCSSCKQTISRLF